MLLVKFDISMEAPFTMYHILYIYRFSVIESKWHFCLDQSTKNTQEKAKGGKLWVADTLESI